MRLQFHLFGMRSSSILDFQSYSATYISFSKEFCNCSSIFSMLVLCVHAKWYLSGWTKDHFWREALAPKYMGLVWFVPPIEMTLLLRSWSI